jgi:hypothetical protein
MPMIPFQWSFRILTAPGSAIYEVRFWTDKTFLRVENEAANYSVFKNITPVARGLTGRPFTMNAAMTILQDYLDEKHKDNETT